MCPIKDLIRIIQQTNTENKTSTQRHKGHEAHREKEIKKS